MNRDSTISKNTKLIVSEILKITLFGFQIFLCWPKIINSIKRWYVIQIGIVIMLNHMLSDFLHVVVQLQTHSHVTITPFLVQTTGLENSDGPGQPIFSVRQANIFKRLVRQTTMSFCPSDSIYLKANALLGTGLTVIQSQPSWSCLPAWHAWCLYHVYWSTTRLKLISTENNIKNQYEPYVWIKGHYDRKT